MKKITSYINIIMAHDDGDSLSISIIGTCLNRHLDIYINRYIGNIYSNSSGSIVCRVKQIHSIFARRCVILHDRTTLNGDIMIVVQLHTIYLRFSVIVILQNRCIYRSTHTHTCTSTLYRVTLMPISRVTAAAAASIICLCPIID